VAHRLSHWLLIMSRAKKARVLARIGHFSFAADDIMNNPRE
jgi:hypothetical protein